MKKVAIISLVLIAILMLYAKSQKISVSGDKIELKFEKVNIKSIKFIDDNDIIFESVKKVEVTAEVKENVVTFSAPEFVKIKLMLPENKLYTYRSEDAICEFTTDQVTVNGDDGEIVIFNKEGLSVLSDDGESLVQIGDEGIIINEDDEKVVISSEGIIIDNEDEYKEITGFWGKLLGSFIKAVAKGSVSIVSKNPDKIMKHIINNEDDDNFYNFSFSDSDDDDNNELISTTFNSTYDPGKFKDLKVINYQGFVKIDKWSKDYIDIYAEIKTRKNKAELEKINIEIYEQDAIVIEVIKLEKKPKVWVEFIIKVPESVNISEVYTSNGKIQLTDLSGDAKLNTSNGKIKVQTFSNVVNIVLLY